MVHIPGIFTKARCLIFLILVILLGLACSSPDSPAGITKAANNFNAMKDALDKESPAIEDIQQLYTGPIKAFIAAQDKENKSSHQKNIEAAIQDFLNVTSMKSQIIDKTIQLVFYNYFQKHLALIGGNNPKDKNLAEIEQIKAAYQGLKYTVIRRSRWIGRKEELDNQMTQLQAKLLDAANKDDKAQFEGIKKTMDEILKKTYALSVLYEAMKLEKLRGIDPIGVKIKKTEALLFYNILTPQIQAKYPKVHEQMDTMLKGEIKHIRSETVKQLLEQALDGIKLETGEV
jgi:hypothetical protein